MQTPEEIAATKAAEEAALKANGGQHKVEFTPEQQKVLNNLIDAKYAEAYTKAEAKTNAEMTVLRQQLAEAHNNKGKDKDLTAVQERIAALEKELQQEKDSKVKSNMTAIAAELNAVSGEQVAMLISPFVKIENGKAVILNAAGEVRFNSEGKPMSLKELTAEYLKNNPHLMKASGSAGSGSQGAGAANFIPSSAEFLKLSPVEQITRARAAGIKR